MQDRIEFLKKIKGLTVKQLKEWRDLIDHELYLKAENPDNAFLSFYELVIVALKDKTGKQYSPFPTLKKNSSKLAYDLMAVQSEYLEWIKAIVKNDLKMADLSYYYDLLFTIIFASLETRDIPVSLKTFTGFAKNFQIYFSQEFPGYEKTLFMTKQPSENINSTVDNGQKESTWMDTYFERKESFKNYDDIYLNIIKNRKD